VREIEMEKWGREREGGREGKQGMDGDSEGMRSM